MVGGGSLEGAGTVTWWGFSPARDLLATGPVKQQGENGELHVLLVGSSDPRHILKTVAGLKVTDRLHVWVIENSMEVMARQLLLLLLSLQEDSSVHKKAEVFLEVFGNSELRSETGKAVRQAAAQLSHCITDCLETDPHPCLDTTRLKFRERDELVRIFRSWVRSCTPEGSGSGPVSITRSWDARVRQHLGTRYDARRGCFDWDLAMKLHHRGAGVISKQQYGDWRGRGLAFQMREGLYQTPNTTLLSTRILTQVGYWGDIVSGPFLSFGVETGDQSLLQTQNGAHVKTSQDVSMANLQELLRSLASRGEPASSVASRGEPASSLASRGEPASSVASRGEPASSLASRGEPASSVASRGEPASFLASRGEPASSVASRGEPASSVASRGEPASSQQEEPLDDTPSPGLLLPRGVCVSFLPLDSLSRLADKKDFSHFFHRIYLSASLAHLLGSSVQQICSPEGLLVVELARFLLDLSPHQERGFEETVVGGAKAAGFDLWTPSDPDLTHAIFTLQTPTLDP
ncbi:hypothetical protein NHX12_024743 [Muraenolepis orangiensis]|uniref:Dynein axonemal assembly factor 3 n=1 Tax=Muraenolepis orangiensis TaxID=630683 RepID=A0A9Q0IP11_9TELE|nr:hypothetical protein NHX12_024743 [Muraenolepis orangiensis]